MARGLAAKGEKIAWAMVVLVALMALSFFILHLASSAPIVGGVATAAATRASGAAYGY